MSRAVILNEMGRTIDESRKLVPFAKLELVAEVLSPLGCVMTSESGPGYRSRGVHRCHVPFI